MSISEQSYITIYYTSSNWHELIKIIRNFLSKQKSSLCLKSFHIYFSTFRGDHIQIILNTISTKSKISQALKIKLKNFILECPSESKPIKYPLPFFFMNYPNNSIWLGKFKMSRTSSKQSLLENIRFVISRVMINAFGSEMVDADLIYSFIVYMLLGMCKTLYPTPRDAYNKILVVSVRLNNKQKLTGTDISSCIEDGSSSFFTKEAGILQEIVNEVWDKQGYSDSMFWMQIWEEECKSYLNERNFSKLFLSISNILYEHLGIEYHGEAYIINITTKCLFAFK